jgi:serine/threonine-protein kinase RsbW
MTAEHRRLRIQAGQQAIGTIADWAESSALVLGLDPNAAMMARLCIEEAVTNIVLHAYDDDPAGHAIQIESSTQNGRLYFALFDDGRPFDPLSFPDAPEEVELEDVMDAELSGRGIRLMRTFSKKISYKREDGINLLIFTF